MGQTWKERLVYAAVWMACAGPLIWLVWLGFTGGLGANPIEKIIRTLGDDALYLLIATLAVTPVARILRQPRLIRLRRTVGLWTFAYAVMHVGSYVGVDQFFDWTAIGKDIVKRPFITVGLVAFVLMIPLAVTSTNAMVRRLGPRTWARLHRLIYLIAPLALVHYFLMVKRDTRPVLTVALIAAVLLAWRAARWAMGLWPRRG